MNLHRRRAFTWLEMLGVLATLLLLAAILFPVFARSRETCGPPSCRSYLRQLAMGLEMYVQDHDHRLPPADAWQDLIYPYIKTRQAFQCPQRPNLPSGFAYNLLLHQRPLAEVPTPALQPMAFDSSLGMRNGSDLLQSFTTPHAGHGNVAYVDGHVKAARAAPSPIAGLAAPQR